MKNTYKYILILLLSSFIYGQNPQITLQGTTSFSVSSQVPVVYNAINSATLYYQVSWQVLGGTFSACTIEVDSSVNGTSSWGSADTISAQTCTSNGNATSTAHTVNYVRLNTAASLVSSGTPTLYVTLTGFNDNPAGGGGGGGGVTSINSTAGAFTFNGTGVSCTTTTCSFNGGGGTTTNALTVNNGGTGAASGTTFDGSVARTFSYNTFGAQPTLTGTGLARNNGASTELSGDCTTSASNAVTCTKTNGTAFGTFATQNYTTPPIIGAGTANVGWFTDLHYSGSIYGPTTGLTQINTMETNGVTCANTNLVTGSGCTIWNSSLHTMYYCYYNGSSWSCATVGSIPSLDQVTVVSDNVVPNFGSNYGWSPNFANGSVYGFTLSQSVPTGIFAGTYNSPPLGVIGIGYTGTIIGGSARALSNYYFFQDIETPQCNGPGTTSCSSFGVYLSVNGGTPALAPLETATVTQGNIGDIAASTQYTNTAITTATAAPVIATAGNCSPIVEVGFISSVTCTISSAQLLALNTTPVTLVAGQTNHYYSPIQAVVEYVFNTTDYGCMGLLCNSVLTIGLAGYADYSWSFCAVGVCGTAPNYPSTLLSGSTGSISETLTTGGITSPSVPNIITRFSGTPITLSVDSALTNGDGTLIVNLLYQDTVLE